MHLRHAVGSALLALASGCAPGAALFGGSSAGERYGDRPLTFDLERPEVPSETLPDPLLGVLAEEVERSMGTLASLPDPRPYFVSYLVTDGRSASIRASFGGILSSEDERKRTLDVDVRVGSPEFDNTHPARGSDLLVRSDLDYPSWQLPLDSQPGMLERTLWVALDTQYRRAVEEYIKVKGNVRVRAETGAASDDFSQEPPLEFVQKPQRLEFDREALTEKLREYSALFRDEPDIYTSSVSFQAEEVTRYLANSEGSRVQLSRTQARIVIGASTRSADGMDLQRYEIVDLGLEPGLPEDPEIREAVAEVIRDVRALRDAPQATPYVGPAILEGEAAGVFAHEVLGHRLEGHRQKSDDEGRTFATKVGEPVLPEFIDIYDDPTIAAINGTLLNGYYPVDDEAVRSQRASLIQEGVLTGFLMSRSPTERFERSNGHGRRQAGYPLVARQGNLVVHPKRTVPAGRLKELLIDEIKRQGKPYGLRFSVVDGGFTNTSRFGVQAFRVNPVLVYRVFPDGREELVRGVSIDGTPLAALSQIIAAGDDVRIFNGVCGAESGSVPVSAVSPSLLLRRVEISGVVSMRNRVPLLTAPVPVSDANTP